MTKTVKERSQAQEKSVAKDFSGSTNVASGAFWNLKGDCRSEKLLIECKTTKLDHFSVNSKVWEKIEEEALNDGMRIPILVVDLKDEHRYIVFDPRLFVKDIPNPYTLDTRDKVCRKSYPIYLDTLDKVGEIIGKTVSAKNFRIKGDREHRLCFMQLKDFIDNYRDEIF